MLAPRSGQAGSAGALGKEAFAASSGVPANAAAQNEAVEHRA
jgi:hypothetical protein